MTIDLFSKGVKLLTVTPDDTSYRYRKIGGEDRILLTFSAPRHIKLAVGLTVSFQGREYTMYSPATITKVNDRHWKYSLTLDAPQELLRKWRMKHRTDGAVKFHLTAKPEEHLRMLVDCANASDVGAIVKWSIGSCIDAPEKLITYNHTDLLSALGAIAKAFDIEWEADGKQIHLRKVEYYKDNPLPLSYGQGNGLCSGVKRENDSKATRLSRLYVQGSDRNIEHAKYGAKTLHIPKEVTVKFDGEKFEGEAGYIASKAQAYKVSADGLYVERTDDPQATGNEGSVEATDIYPSRVGVVSAVTEDGKETKTKHALYSVYDSSIPESLNFTEVLIPNQPLQVIFQSGMLAGVTFEAHYYHNAGTDKPARRLALLPKEEDGVIMPSATYLPKVGDKYAVFNVNLPQSYLRDDTTKTGAEWELLRRALKYLYQSSLEAYVYKAELDGLWTKKDWLNRGGRIRLGAYVRLSDPELIPDGVDIRIIGVKDFLNAPESPEIELSNNAVGSSILSTIEQLKDSVVQSKDKEKELYREGRRTLQQAIEASEKIAKAFGDKYGKEITPVLVRTMQLIAGDPSLQFRFIDSSGNTTSWSPVFNKQTKVLVLPDGEIEHLTANREAARVLSSSIGQASMWRFGVRELSSPPLTDSTKSYYIYVSGVLGGIKGKWQIKEDFLPFEDGNKRNLLVGIVSSEGSDGDRSFTRLYGFTEILPGQIRTEKIATPDGRSYFDLVSGVIASRNIRFVYSDGSEHPHPDTYLYKAIKEGSTDIQGGLVLSSIIGAKDGQGNVRSFIAGDITLPAFSAGVSGWGTPQRKAITEINHDGTGHIGNMHIEQGGSVIVFKGEEGGRDDVRIGGAQTPLKDLLSSSFQDSASTKNVQREEVTQNSFDKEVRQVEIFRVGFNVQNDGSMIQFEIPWNISVRHENSQYHKITSYATILLRITDSKGAVVYEFTEYLRSGAMQGFMPSQINYPLQADKRGLAAGLYVFSLVANISTVLDEGENGYAGPPAVTTFTSQPFVLKYKVSGRNDNVREVVFGKFGLSAFYGHKQLFYLQNSAKEGAPFLTIRGKTDIPGVLFSGDFWPSDQNGGNVQSEDSYGALFPNGIYCERVGVGQYKINHKLGRSNYTVQVCPIYRTGYEPSNDVMTRVEFKGENSFNVVTGVGSNKTNYVPFSVLIVGANYKE